MNGDVVTNTDRWLRRGWHPVARLADIGAEPQRVELLGDGYVVVRLGGAVRAFADRCPHRGARLSRGTIVAGALQCPYHGWCFDAAGSCCAVPALGPGVAAPRADLVSIGCEERDGLVWLAPEPPVCPIIDPMPDGFGADRDDLVTIELPPVDVRTTAAQVVENFLDIAHFPFVHSATFGGGSEEYVEPFEVRQVADGWGLVLDYEHTIDNHEDPLVATGEHPLVQPRRMRYECRLPFSATLRLEFPLTGAVNVLVLHCQPCDADVTRVYMSMIRDDCPTADDQRAAADFELAVFAEDMSILEYLPTGMPLTPGAEPATRADRLTIGYRRLLRRLAEGSALDATAG